MCTNLLELMQALGPICLCKSFLTRSGGLERAGGRHFGVGDGSRQSTGGWQGIER